MPEFRYRWLPYTAAACLSLLQGCQPAMTTSPSEAPVQNDALGGKRMQPPPETLAVPLRFGGHGFEAHCYNTFGCQVDYADVRQVGLSHTDDPDGYRSPAPPSNDYKDHWGPASHIGIRNFPPPAQVRWKSLDGAQHEASVDVAALFKDELIWHKVPKEDMFKFFEGPYAGDPSIYLEVNDRTINIYTRMLVPTLTEQIPGNKHSSARTDLFLVWTRVY